MLPIFPDEIDAAEQTKYTEVVPGPYVRPPVQFRADTTGQKSDGPLALDFHPANTDPPVLVQYARENNQEFYEQYNNAVDRNFYEKSETATRPPPRSTWGQDIE